MLGKRSIVLVVLAISTCAAVRCYAESAEVKQSAKAHFRKGAELYAAGDYANALAEYKVAYRLLPLPDLLFNIGQAHRMNQQPREALDYYRQYLAAQPDGPAADEARLHVAELTRAVRLEDQRRQAEEEKAKKEADEAAAKAAAEEKARAEEAARLAALQQPATPPPPPPPKPLARRPWFIATIVVVAAAVVGGVTAGAVVGGSRTQYPSVTFKTSGN